MTQNVYIRPKSLYTNILSIIVEIWVISCHVWRPNVTQRISYTHIILPRSRIKYAFCSFWNLALFQILPVPFLSPSPLHYVLASTVYDIILHQQAHLWIAHNLNSFIGVEIHRPVASHWQTISQNVVSNTPLHVRDSNSQRQWW